MGIRILSGAGRHEFIDDWRDRSNLDGTGLFGTKDYDPMICLHCGTQAWRHKGTARIQLLDYDSDLVPRGRSGPMPYLRNLQDPEKSCEYMIVKQIMEG